MPLVLLLVLLLTGCEEQKDLLRLGMLNAPVAYLGALGLLIALRRIWRWRCPDSAMRPAVAAIPLALLVIAALFGLFIGGNAKTSSADLFWGAVMLSPALTPFICGALCVPLCIVWRLWFLVAPQSSYEGAALVVTPLFFAPGLLALLGLIPTTMDLVAELSLICLYMSGFFTPVFLALLLDALIARSNAGKRAQRAGAKAA